MKPHYMLKDRVHFRRIQLQGPPCCYTVFVWEKGLDVHVYCLFVASVSRFRALSVSGWVGHFLLL